MHDATHKTLRWWPILLAVVTIAATWGAFGTKIHRNTSDIDKLNTVVTELDRSIPKIQSDIEWIRETLTEMREED